MPDVEWDDEERAAARERGWDGQCKLWARRCAGGKRCGRDPEFRTPITFPTPKVRPPGCPPGARRIATCPERIPARVSGVIRRWQDARRAGEHTLPGPGHPQDQDAWMLSAFSVLDAEMSLIKLAIREEQAARAGS